LLWVPGKRSLRCASPGVTPKGGKWWRLKYRFGGKEKLLTYPDTSLKKAREKRDEARALLASGVDPSEARRAEKASGTGAAANSLEAVAREFRQTRQGEWSAPTWRPSPIPQRLAICCGPLMTR
jgi:hypothetical protein